ncbi:MAG: lactate racemase domain-containing protein [Armatimonadota bacterium]
MTAPATTGIGFEDRLLTDDEVRSNVLGALAKVEVAGKRVLLIIPDHTRTAPIGQLFGLIHEAWGAQAAALDCLVALGTHPPLSEEMICARVGLTSDRYRCDFPGVRFFNHLWKDPEALVQIGKLSASEIGEITNGLFELEVPISINRMALEHDLLLIIGPVFPHEVVGFSGGNKYLFPGIAGQHIIDFFHWLGAVITNPVINGNKWTPVRRVVDRAAAMVQTRKLALSLVVKGEDLAGVYFGVPEESWSQAADLSAKLHVVYKDRPFHTVLSQAPAMYDEIWTAGKCMYKLEPVVADGGTLIIYAPHLKEISCTHGAVIEAVGYHTRDYFLKQWDRFKQHPWGVLAHSTHVKGIGSYENGMERPRVNVVLATQIPRDVCERINLGYMDPATIHPQDYADREDEGVLYVPKAGEILYRLRNAPPELGGNG